jgi:hypothetical protein
MIISSVPPKSHERYGTSRPVADGAIRCSLSGSTSANGGTLG